MRSSIFSFNRAPDGGRKGIFAISFVVFVFLLASYEIFWRARGVEPAYVDDPRRWSFFRGKVDGLTGRNSTILIGGSRIQLGWSLGTFRSLIPQTPIVQLSVSGNHPIAVLHDLSNNTRFAGVVVVALTAGGILPGARDGAQSHVKFYANSWTLNKKVNFLIDDVFQSFLASRHPHYSLSRTIRSAFFGRFQRGPNYLETTYERESNADYRRLNIFSHRAERIRRVVAGAARFKPPSREVWIASAKKLDQIVRPMLQRGARVVFVRFPTSDEHWKLDQINFPRKQYWDDLSKSVSGYWVHFKDVDGMDRFVLPDTSHLDKRDKANFTRLMIAKLLELGMYH